MANNEIQTEENTNKQQIGAKVDPAIKAAIVEIAAEEERSESQVIERALRVSPAIMQRLETAGAAA
jgi:predicted transcriptional regulator